MRFRAWNLVLLYACTIVVAQNSSAEAPPLASAEVVHAMQEPAQDDNLLIVTGNVTTPEDLSVNVTAESQPKALPQDEAELTASSSASVNATVSADFAIANSTVDISEVSPSTATTQAIPPTSTTSLEPEETASAVIDDTIASPVDPSVAPEFLSFNEWREKYAVVPENARKPARKIPARTRNDSFTPHVEAAHHNSGNGHGNETQVRDQGTAGTSQGQVPAETSTEDPATPDEHALDFPVQPGTQQKISSPASPIQPLPNVGTGDASDPLLLLKDRSNYAATKCAAMVHRSSKESKGAASILVEQKDRYMLTPCSAESKFVEIGLCDEIQIDTVVLANFELFSSMFKHFEMTCSVHYPGKPDTWHHLGHFRARNIRGIQVFRPDPIPNFCRHLRINFLSHYGSEFYCPVSLLRVYGFTQIDAWRESERKAREEAEREQDLAALGVLDDEDAFLDEEELEDTVYVHAEIVPAVPTVTTSSSVDGEKNSTDVLATNDFTTLTTASETPSTDSRDSVQSSGVTTSASDLPAQSAEVTSATSTMTLESTPSIESLPTSVLISESAPSQPAITTVAATDESSSPISAQSTTSDDESFSATVSSESATITAATPMNSTVNSTVALSPEPTSLVEGIPSSSISSAISEHSSDANNSSVQATNTNATTAMVSATPNATTSAKSVPTNPNVPVESIPASTAHTPPTVEVTPLVTTRHVPRNDTRLPPLPPMPPPASQQPQPGESIYGTIMKRLSSLEHDQTLAMHYIEAQSRFLRETFLRIEHRLGEIEGTRHKQDQILRQTLSELEQKRGELEVERVALTSQVKMLNQEIRLEKRLSVAQLIGLLTLFVFVGVTRGSPTSPFVYLSSSQGRRAAVAQANLDAQRPVRPPIENQSQNPRASTGYRANSLTGLGRMSSLKRATIAGKSAPRRHYGNGAAMKNTARSPRTFTPPQRHASAPPDDLFAVSLSSALRTEDRREAMRRRPKRPRPEEDLDGVQQTTIPSGSVHTTTAKLQHTAGTARAGRPSFYARPSAADDADTEPSDAADVSDHQPESAEEEGPRSMAHAAPRWFAQVTPPRPGPMPRHSSSPHVPLMATDTDPISPLDTGRPPSPPHERPKTKQEAESSGIQQ